MSPKKKPAKPKNKPVEKTIEPSAPAHPEVFEDIQAQYHFTMEEVAHMERDLRVKLNALDLLEDQKKSAMQDFKLRTTNVENEAKMLRNKLDSGEETRPMRARVEFDIKRGFKRYLHPETAVFIQESPMQPADWQLPMFKTEETKNEATGVKPPEPPPFVVDTFMKQCVASLDDEVKMKEHFETVREMKVPAYQGPFKKMFVLFKKDIAEIRDAAQPEQGGAEENGQGTTNLGQALDKAAVNGSTAPLILDLDAPDYEVPGLMAAFRRSAKAAGWSPVQIKVLAEQLTEMDGVAKMIESLRPFVKTPAHAGDEMPPV